MPKDKENDDELIEKNSASPTESDTGADAENVLPTEEHTEQQSSKGSKSTKSVSQEIEAETINAAENIDKHDIGVDVDSDAVTIQPVEFVSFDHDANPVGEENKNLEMLLDIKLELTVELGRCELPIKKILELTRDSIVELDKIAGEPVSLYANGKHIANGEVVVIEDNFGLRITSIIEPEKRLKSLDS